MCKADWAIEKYYKNAYYTYIVFASKNIYKNLHQIFTAESKFWYVWFFMPLEKFIHIGYNAKKITNGKEKGECHVNYKSN